MKTATEGPYVLQAHEGEAIWFSGNLVTIKAAGPQTRGRLTVAEFLNPAGFAPPLHRHLIEDEMFHVLWELPSSAVTGSRFSPDKGDFVFLPIGLPHTFLVVAGRARW